MQQEGSKVILKILGYAVVVASFIYLGLRLAEHFESITFTLLQAEIMVVTLGVCIGYTVLQTILPWIWIVLATNGWQASLRGGFTVYGRAQITKYLPGNIAQIGVRQLLGARIGLRQRDMGWATTLEIVLMAAAAAAVALAAAPSQFAPWLGEAPSVVLLAALTAALAAAWLALRLSSGTLVRRRFPRVAKIFRAVGWQIFMGSFAAYLVFFIASGLLIYVLLAAVQSGMGDPARILLVVGASAAAWLAGFVTPGSPGGLGVREATFVLLAGPEIGQEPALIGMLLFRVVTSLSDVTFFLLAVRLRPARAGSGDLRDHVIPSS
jgi:hypothetical protein